MFARTITFLRGFFVGFDEDETHSTHPDQDLGECEATPTPEESLNEPPAQHTAPKKAGRPRKYPIKHSQAELAAIRFMNAQTRLQGLCQLLYSEAYNPIDWLQSKSSDNELSEMLPIWTENCVRSHGRHKPIPLSMVLNTFDLAWDMVSADVAQRCKLQKKMIRGEQRMHLSFADDRARLLYLAYLLDVVFDKLCIKPATPLQHHNQVKSPA